MGNTSKIILVVFAVVLVLGVGQLFMGSSNYAALFEMGTDSASNDYNLHYDNVKPISSVIELTKTESKSDTFAFYYPNTNTYAEPAYSRYVSEYVYIEIDTSKMKLANDSYIDDSAGKSAKDGNIYNKSHFKKDLKAMLKHDKYPASLALYDKNGNQIASISDLEVSLDGNVLTAEYSYTNTSQYYTEYERGNHLTTKFKGDSFAMNDDFHNVKKAKLTISGSTDDRDSNRTVEININTKNLEVSSSVSTDFVSTYDDD